MSTNPRAEAHAPPRVAVSGLAWPKQLVVSASILAGLALLLYGHVLLAMVQQWAEDPNWGHGFLVAPFAAWIAWRERKRWLNTGGTGSWLGLVGMAAAVTLLLFGSLAAELFTTRISFVFWLASLVLFLGGWRRLRALAFPLAYLLFMIPWPAIIYAQVTLPLELLASRWAAGALQLFHIPVFREGNVLVLANYTLQVAEACSGIRSLVSLITLAIAYVYLTENRAWLRLTLVALMVPIAVISNAFRIFGTGVLTAKVSPELAHGFFHEFSGWLIFLAAAFLMLVTHKILRKIAEPRRRSADV